MEKRIGVSAGVLAVAPAVALGIFEVMGWKMPPQLAIALLVVITITGGIALLVLVHGVWIGSRPIRNRYRLRSPWYELGKPDSNQWLLDIAKHDAENPQGELRVLSQSVTEWDFDPATRRPWIEITFKLFNGGVHTIVIGPATGRPKHNRDELPDEVEVSGRSRMDRGHTAPYKLKVHVPRDVADKIFHEELSVEVARSFRRLRSLSLSGVILQVESEPKDGNTGSVVKFGLGSDDTFLVGDTN